MLSRGAVKGVGQEREEKPLKDLDGRCKERDGTIQKALVRRLTRFHQRNDNSLFPDGRNVSAL